jgi:hypothetical protein
MTSALCAGFRSAAFGERALLRAVRARCACGTELLWAYRVVESAGYRQLIHGTTIHGIQSLDPARAREPLSYFYRTGPIGQVFLTPAISKRLRQVAIVGLGAGSLACYSEPWRHFTYYEIDPLVERIARDTRYFTFFRDCSPGTQVVIGDARLSLRFAPAHGYDMIVLDAFSSDTLPVHLVTREAVELYVSKLTDHGFLAFNISNRYLDLRSVFAEVARDEALVAIFRSDLEIGIYEQKQGKFGSAWVLMAHAKSDLDALGAQPLWHELQPASGNRLWTDDYSSIVNVIRWH